MFLKIMLFGLLCVFMNVEFSFASPQQKLFLQIQQSHYLSEASQSSHQSDYSNMMFNYLYFNSTREKTFKLSANGIATLNSESEHYFSVPELYYLKNNINSNLSVSFGRRIYDWSFFDKYWDLSLWQPQLIWDRLFPQTQGLTGVFTHYKQGKFQMLFYASPLFIPNQGANVEVQEGRLVSPNRWFRNRVDHVQIANGNSDLFYKLDRPAINEVISQNSYGVLVRLGRVNRGIWFQSAYAYKPQNMFQYAFDPTLEISLSSSGQTIVNVYPVVVYHHLYALEMGFTSGALKSWVSVNSEIPVQKAIDKNKYIAKLPNTSFAGGTIAIELDALGFNNTEISGGILKKWDEDVIYPNISIFNNKETQIKRFMFDSAVMLKIENRIENLGKAELKSDIKYTYSPEEQGSILSFGSEYSYNEKWALRFSVDILGVNDKDAEGFIAENMTNDRLSGSFTYVF